MIRNVEVKEKVYELGNIEPAGEYVSKVRPATYWWDADKVREFWDWRMGE